MDTQRQQPHKSVWCSCWQQHKAVQVIWLENLRANMSSGRVCSNVGQVRVGFKLGLVDDLRLGLARLGFACPRFMVKIATSEFMMDDNPDNAT